MAEFQHPFVQAATREAFEAKLNAGVISNYQIAFIEDTKEIWARGVYYPCPYSKNELDKFIKDLSDANQEIQENITNIADEEDITLTEEKKLQLKDRDSSKGMGYKILRLPKNGILTYEMINESNTIYEIRYNFDLNGEEITIPNNCTLKFEGGSFSNGIIHGNNTSIKASAVVFHSVSLKTGSFQGDIYAEWFESIQEALNSSESVVLTKSTYNLTSPIKLNENNKLTSSVGSKLAFSLDTEEYCITMGANSSLIGVHLRINTNNGGIRLDLEELNKDITILSKFSATLSNLVRDCEIRTTSTNSFSGISVTANGHKETDKLSGFWGGTFENIMIFGEFQSAIYLSTGSTQNNPEKGWISGVTFANVKIFGAINGVISEAEFVDPITDPYRRKLLGPCECIFNGVDIQYEPDKTERHFVLNSAAHWVIEKCISWDFPAEVKPYLINPNNCNYLKIGPTVDLYKPYEFSETLSTLINLRIEGPSGTSFILANFLPSLSDDKHTANEIFGLPPGIYSLTNYNLECLGIEEELDAISLEVSDTWNGQKVLRIIFDNANLPEAVAQINNFGEWKLGKSLWIFRKNSEWKVIR